MRWFYFLIILITMHYSEFGLAEFPSSGVTGGRRVYGYHGRKADLLYLHLLFIQAVEKNTHAT